jgi:hypothetical protein
LRSIPLLAASLNRAIAVEGTRNNEQDGHMEPVQGLQPLSSPQHSGRSSLAAVARSCNEVLGRRRLFQGHLRDLVCPGSALLQAHALPVRFLPLPSLGNSADNLIRSSVPLEKAPDERRPPLHLHLLGIEQVGPG